MSSDAGIDDDEELPAVSSTPALITTPSAVIHADIMKIIAQAKQTQVESERKQAELARKEALLEAEKEAAKKKKLDLLAMLEADIEDEERFSRSSRSSLHSSNDSFKDTDSSKDSKGSYGNKDSPKAEMETVAKENAERIRRLSSGGSPHNVDSNKVFNVTPKKIGTPEEIKETEIEENEVKETELFHDVALGPVKAKKEYTQLPNGHGAPNSADKNNSMHDSSDNKKDVAVKKQTVAQSGSPQSIDEKSKFDCCGCFKMFEEKKKKRGGYERNADGSGPSDIDMDDVDINDRNSITV